MIMAVVRTSETSVCFEEITRRCIPEGSHLQSHHSENLKCRICSCILLYNFDCRVYSCVDIVEFSIHILHIFDFNIFTFQLTPWSRNLFQKLIVARQTNSLEQKPPSEANSCLSD
jgi:hypothetical protein